MDIKPGDVYSAEAEVKAPETADLTLEGPMIPEGRVVLIQAFYVLDRSTAGKVLRLGYDRAGTKYWLKRVDLGIGNYGIWQDGPLYLVGGEKPVGMVEDATKGDVCILVARGEYVC